MKLMIRLGQFLLAGKPWLRSTRTSKPKQLELPFHDKPFHDK